MESKEFNYWSHQYRLFHGDWPRKVKDVLQFRKEQEKEAMWEFYEWDQARLQRLEGGHV